MKWDGSSGNRIIYNKENLYEAKIQDGKFYYAWQPHWHWDGGVSLNANEWTHFVVTYDHNTQKVYKNGSLAYSRSQTGDIGSNTSKLLIATRGDANSKEYFGGDIDELKIFDRDLNDTQIQTIYNNEKSGKNYDGTDRVCECMSYMQTSCDIRRGHHDAKIFIFLLYIFISVYLKVFSLFPKFIVALLYIFWIVNCTFFAHNRSPCYLMTRLY